MDLQPFHKGGGWICRLNSVYQVPTKIFKEKNTYFVLKEKKNYLPIYKNFRIETMSLARE